MPAPRIVASECTDGGPYTAEVLPLLHPVRLARAIFYGPMSPVVLWDIGYILIVSVLLLDWADRAVRRRLTG